MQSTSTNIGEREFKDTCPSLNEFINPIKEINQQLKGKECEDIF